MSFRRINANVPQPPQRRKSPRAKSEEELVQFWKKAAARSSFFFFSPTAPHGCTPVISSFAGSKGATGACKKKRRVGGLEWKRGSIEMIFQESPFTARGRDAGGAAEGLCFTETIILRLTSPGLLLSRIFAHDTG